MTECQNYPTAAKTPILSTVNEDFDVRDWVGRVPSYVSVISSPRSRLCRPTTQHKRRSPSCGLGEPLPTFPTANSPSSCSGRQSTRPKRPRCLGCDQDKAWPHAGRRPRPRNRRELSDRWEGGCGSWGGPPVTTAPLRETERRHRCFQRRSRSARGARQFNVRLLPSLQDACWTNFA